MSSLAFDRAVPYYDRTRALAPAHAAALNLALIEHGRLGAGSRALEVGVGTGRIAAPLLACGVPLVGLDLSRPMMALFRAKWPRSTLAQADACRLPLASDSFDAVVLVHVLHLVADWREALLEAARVLRPGGVLLHAWRDRESAEVGERLHTRFRELVEGRGERFGPPGNDSDAARVAYWSAQGWDHTAHEVAAWQDEQTGRSALDQLASRQWSSTWTIGDETFAAAIEELEAWAAAELGDLQQPWPRRQRLVLDVVRPTG